MRDDDTQALDKHVALKRKQRPMLGLAERAAWLPIKAINRLVGVLWLNRWCEWAYYPPRAPLRLLKAPFVRVWKPLWYQLNK